VSVQDRCTICVKRTIGSENRFRYTQSYSRVMRLKWKLDLVRLETVLILVQDRCMVCTKRTIGSKIVLDALDGTTW
jgi:hypothetical protein